MCLVKKTVAFLVFITVLSCSPESQELTEKDIIIEEEDVNQKDDELTEEGYVSPTIISEGNVSDISLYSSKPYYMDNSGYNGDEFFDLELSRIKEFIHVDGESDTVRLEALIAELSALGGGKITIKSGTYAFRDVQFKSNIHLIIESGTIIKLEKESEGRNGVNGYRLFFGLSSDSDVNPLENVRIMGLGTPDTRPKLVLKRFKESWGEVHNRAITFGYAKNILVENLTIEDNYTKGAAIAFNPVDYGENNLDVKIPENITITNVSLKRGSIGYGLAQTGVGKNILLKNLECEGGMTCRIETHTGRQYDLGVNNVVIKNVSSINGKAAVLLQPHSVLNGRVIVDRAKSVGSTWTLFLKEGFVGENSKRRAKGDFDENSEFKNISMVSTDDTATLSFKNFSFVPVLLKELYNSPNYKVNIDDVNNGIDDFGNPKRESAIFGPSIAVVYNDARYKLTIPDERDLIISGETENRLKLLVR